MNIKNGGKKMGSFTWAILGLLGGILLGVIVMLIVILSLTKELCCKITKNNTITPKVQRKKPIFAFTIFEKLTH